MDGLPESTLRFIQQHGLMPRGSRGVVAVSGGVDSLVLLDVLRSLGEWPLHVATLDHGVRGEAGAADADWVRALAEHWALPVTVGRVDVPALAEAFGIGLEDAARRARYTFLARVALAVGAGWIAVAHHAGDQAETVLMHIIRGSGLEGLRGMLPVGPLAEEAWLPDLHIACEGAASSAPTEHTSTEAWRALRVVRPLLEVPRAAIEAYASARGLIPRQDATNTDQAYLRNRTRHELIPRLETVNPQVSTALVRLASIAREDVARLTAANESILARIADFGGAGGWARLDRRGWDALNTAEQRGVLREAVRRMSPGLHDLGLDAIERALALAAGGRVGAVAILPGGLQMRVEPDALLLTAAEDDPADWIDAPALESGQIIGPFVADETVRQVCGGWTFSSRMVAAGDNLSLIHADPLAAALSVPSDAFVVLRTRLPGDRWQPRGLGGHAQPLKAVWQSMKVPKLWRDRVPLLLVAGLVAWFVAPERGRVLRGRVAQPFALPGEPSFEESSRAEARMERAEALNRAIIVVRWLRTVDL